jgi:hypothetical protein
MEITVFDQMGGHDQPDREPIEFHFQGEVVDRFNGKYSDKARPLLNNL